MTDLVLVAGTFVLAGVATVLLAVVVRRSRRRRREQYRRLNDRLETTHPEAKTHLETPPRIQALPVVDRTDDGDPVYAPVVRVDLAMIDAPSMELVFQFVASVLEAIHPVVDEERAISHYDVQFRFGPDGLLVSRLCQRVSIPRAMAVRLCTEERFGPHELRRAVERADDGDETTGPVLWGDC